MAKRTLTAMLLCIFFAPTTSAVHAEMAYEVEWIRQLGTSKNDASYTVAVDGSGNAFITGRTQGSLGGPHAGLTDAFLVKFSPIPEPGTLTLAAFGLLGLAAIGRRRR